ncbi:MAG: YjjG family noncanonical pyrimidine nucleotidase [Oscillospiraceae bacterium]|nr:YjjG family noncanonical pyrimidine nucleotidase [Oscillospiraceae bacterium]
MIEFLFLDLDDTILDFHKAERIAISKTFQAFGLEPTEAVLDRYHVINRQHWERLEKGELTREQVLQGRFEVLFREMGRRADAAAIARTYEHNLSIGHYFLPGAREALDALGKHCRLYLASNGTASVQQGRLTSAGLYPVFEKVFVSQELGFNKPSIEFFNACTRQIPGYDPKKAMMVGDSLTSDIQGGINAGMATCWVNPTHAPGRPDIRPNYEIGALSELEGLLIKEKLL